MCLSQLSQTPAWWWSKGSSSKTDMGSEQAYQTSSHLPLNLTTRSPRKSQNILISQKRSYVASRSVTRNAQRHSCTGLALPASRTRRPRCGCGGCWSGRRRSAETCSGTSLCRSPAGTDAAGPCRQTNG